MSGLDSDLVDNLYAKGASERNKSPIPLPGGAQGFIIPEGYELKRVEPLEPELPRIKQRVSMRDLASFTSYINRYKSEATRIFGMTGQQSSSKQALFSAIIDYHAKGRPEYCAHGVSYAPVYSEQWKRWTTAAAMTQPEFAEFIEENRKDIVEPVAASLLDIVSKFRAKKTVDFDAVVYQQNGDLTLGYSEKTEHQGKQGIVVPQTLSLGIPVFFKGEVYSVPVFLRYRLQEARLSFSVKVDRPEYIEQDAFDHLVASITEATETEVYIGQTL